MSIGFRVKSNMNKRLLCMDILIYQNPLPNWQTYSESTMLMILKDVGLTREPDKIFLLENEFYAHSVNKSHRGPRNTHLCLFHQADCR